MTRLRRHTAAIAFLLAGTTSALAIDTATITASALSPDCLEYRVVGICYWLRCGVFGCSVRTSVKIRHYAPDAVVSSYANIGGNPWLEMRPMSLPNPTATGGGDGTTNQERENNLQKFKNADVIGHPAGAAFSKFAGTFGFACEGAGTPFMPYLLSALDTVGWRYNLPESVYPEALIPGTREIGSRTSLNLWGSVYPRGGMQHQTDDYKAGAVGAQRAGDIVTRRGQPHVYQPLLASPRDGYWPAGALVEGDARTGKWQELTPRLSNTCAVFPHNAPRMQARKGDYAWSLWRPYSCCQRRGQVFLGSTDF
ncbi:TIGR03756 family integrating conjugative element protein [Shinella sp.]|uniref:TIGR03756 family integrating conjugative element protein n=1 Tax=Shinella sp. TaxID=1870904 RepID=UPI00258533CA|nr:TIGR03756 family integrating conjugative element protein [Shinella sp.]MCW5706960.1 TIGR03756 family integrating conjugative element protein [Shinella sp.]